MKIKFDFKKYFQKCCMYVEGYHSFDFVFKLSYCLIFSCSKKASQLKQSLVPWKFVFYYICGSCWPVQFSCLVVSDSLQPHLLQHTRPPSPLLEFTETHVRWVGDAIQPSHIKWCDVIHTLGLIKSIYWVWWHRYSWVPVRHSGCDTIQWL